MAKKDRGVGIGKPLNLVLLCSPHARWLCGALCRASLFRRKAVQETVHRGLGVCTCPLVNIEAALARKEVAQGIDTHGASSKEPGQGVRVAEIAIKAPAKDPGDSRVFRK